jgi:hypothetical protein
LHSKSKAKEEQNWMEEGTDYVFHKLAESKDQYGALLEFGVDRLDVLGKGLQRGGRERGEWLRQFP